MAKTDDIKEGVKSLFPGGSNIHPDLDPTGDLAHPNPPRNGATAPKSCEAKKGCLRMHGHEGPCESKLAAVTFDEPAGDDVELAHVTFSEEEKS